MANQYVITIENNSDSAQSYALFTAQPEITGEVEPKIWNNVFATGNALPRQVTVFTVYKQYFALTGASSGSPAAGVTVNVSGTQKVTLGVKNNDGTVTSGSTVKYITQKLNTASGPVLIPGFSDTKQPDGGLANAFQIKTDTSFKVTDVENGKWSCSNPVDVPPHS